MCKFCDGKYFSFFRHESQSIIKAGTAVLISKGVIHMTNKEKLIQYIHNLTNEEAETIISYLQESASSEGASPHLLPNTAVQVQEVAV
jgi:predicted metal-dependent hydrolase